MSRLDTIDPPPSPERPAELAGAQLQEAGPDVSAGDAFFLSVVVPVYNESASLGALHRRLLAVFAQLPLSQYEIIFIDDGSRDTSLAEIAWLHQKDPCIRGISFARNFGKEAAMAAGLKAARGDAIVLMDSDLQHPPEVILDFVARWKAGAQMVTALRDSRQTDSLPRRLVSQMFYLLFHYVSDVTIPRGAGDFRLFDRQVVDAINSLPERNRFMKGITSWVGFRQDTVPFTVAERQGGRSAWSLWRLLGYAVDGLSAFSTIPLRVWSVIGLLLALLSVFYGGWIVVKTLLYGRDIPGYASLMAATLFLSGVQLMSLGVLGEYVGRIFAEVKGRPLYLVATRIGFPPETGKTPEDGAGSSQG